MIIEQPEAFKTWLTAVLKPMCEADPAALAKYVLALIKKDKSEEELHRIMVGQLEVFLESETESFVNLVLKTLETQDYITTPVIPNTNPPNPVITVTAVKSTSTTTLVPTPKPLLIPPGDLPTLEINGGGSTTNLSTTTTTSASSTATIMAGKKEKERDRKVEERDEVTKSSSSSSRRPRHRSNSRNRSRSRSWDRKRSKSRDRETHKRPLRGAWRNKSPPRRFDRRANRMSRTPSPPRGRSRSPKHRTGRYRNRTPPAPRTPSRSRSRSPIGRKSSPHSRPGTPTQDSNHGNADLDLRLTNTAQSIQSVVVQSNNTNNNNNNNTTNSNNNIDNSKRRCRDFDEKGYCMRGEMCPFDHGVDPVVLEDSALSSVLAYNAPEAVGVGGGAPPPMPMPPGVVPPGGPPPPNMPPMQMMGPRGIPPEYNPQAPQMWNRGGGFRGPRPMGMPPRGPIMFPPPNMQRELIPVPVLMDNNNKDHQPYPPGGGGGGFRPYPPFHRPPHHHHPHHHNHQLQQQQQQQQQLQHQPPPGTEFGAVANNNAMMTMMMKKKSFDFARLGPLRGPKNNCSLELKKIPQGLNSITHLNNHFSKFGKIVNMQVNYEEDPEAAIVTFSSHAEANAAYRSTEAVLNNRFIKVFWHNGAGGEGAVPATKQENASPPLQSRSVKDRLGASSIVAPNTNKVLNNNNNNNNIKQEKTSDVDENNENSDNVNKNSTSTALNKEESKAQATAAILKNQELLAAKEKLKKNQSEQRREVMKIKQNLRKRKQELLEKQLSQQKILIEKMERLPQGPQRDLVLETIKKTQDSIEGIKKDLQQSVLVAPIVKSPPPLKKAKEDVQREMLDAELDLITKQQEGADTSEIQRKLLELRSRAAMATRGGGPMMATRGRGSARRFNPISRHLLSKNNLVAVGQAQQGKVGGANNLTNKVFQKHTVDHRPTRLLVSGYEAEEQEGVLNHFQLFGEVVDYEVDSTLPSITLNYKGRKEAEMALLKGKHFQDRTLSITWCSSTNPGLSRQTSSSGPANRNALLSESEEDRLIDQGLPEGDEDLGPEISEEALLQDDEEEDDEGEDRSWRR